MISKFSVPKQPYLSTPSSRDVLNPLTCTERRRVHSQPRLSPAFPVPHLPTLKPICFSEARLLKLLQQIQELPQGGGGAAGGLGLSPGWRHWREGAPGWAGQLSRG